MENESVSHETNHGYELSQVNDSTRSSTKDSSVVDMAIMNTLPVPGTNVQQLPAVDRGRPAWIFCISAFVLESLTWGFAFSYGILQAYYITHPPFDSASPITIAAVGPTALAIQYGEGIICSFILGRYPDYLRTVMWLGLGLFSVSLFLSSFVEQAWLLILLQGVGSGIGGGFLYWPVIFLVTEWFVKRRGLAGGIIFAGSGIGGFVFPFILNALLDRVGLPWTLRTWAIIEAVVGGIALLGVKARIPVPKYRNGQQRPRFVPKSAKFLKQFGFWAYSATYLLQSLSFFPVSLYIALFTQTISSPLAATVVLAVFNICGVIGQIIIGYLSDHFAYPWIMFVSTLGSAVAAFLLWGFANTFAFVVAFSILFGGLAGGFSSVAFAAATDSAGPNPEQAPMVMSAFTVVKGLAAIVGPIISGVLLEAGKSSGLGSSGVYGRYGFGPVEIFVGSCAVASTISSLVVAASRSRV